MEVMFVCAYQCYTPSGGPSCRTHIFGSAVAHKDYFFVFFWVMCPWSPSGVTGCRPTTVVEQGLVFCLYLGLTSLVSHGRCRPNKDCFFGTCGFGLLMCSELTSAIVWRLSWFIKNLNGAQRAIRKRGLLWLNYQE